MSAIARVSSPQADDERAGDTQTLFDAFQGFVHELRAAGLPVSMTENLDAMRAVEYVPLDDREALKAALGATLVKHHGHWKVFETVFDVYFSLYSTGVGARAESGEGADGESMSLEQLMAAMEGGGAMGDVDNEQLAAHAARRAR